MDEERLKQWISKEMGDNFGCLAFGIFVLWALAITAFLMYCTKAQ